MKTNKDKEDNVVRDEDEIIIFDPTDDIDDAEGNEDSQESVDDDNVMYVIDEKDGKPYPMPKMNPEYTGKTLREYHLDGTPIEREDEEKEESVSENTVTTGIIIVIVGFVMLVAALCFAKFL